MMFARDPDTVRWMGKPLPDDVDALREIVVEIMEYWTRTATRSPVGKHSNVHVYSRILSNDSYLLEDRENIKEVIAYLVDEQQKDREMLSLFEIRLLEAELRQSRQHRSLLSVVLDYICQRSR